MSEAPFQNIKKWIHHVHFSLFSLFLLACLVILAGISCSLVFNDTVKQDEGLPADRANQIGCPITVPDSAHKVRFASIHNWFEHTIYVRYDADSDICRQQIETVMKEYAPDDSQASENTPLTRITTPQKIDSWSSLGVLSWFNIERIVDGVTKTDSTGKVTIWIDDDRGVFYCRIKD